MQSYHDDQILDALQEGGAAEDTCLRDLYRRELPRMLAFMRKNQGSDEEARDLFQDALIVFIEQVRSGKFRGDASISTFIYGVGRRMWLNRLKRKGIAARYLEEQLKDEPVQETPLRVLLATERDNAFRKLMAGIGERCRKLLQMKMYQQLSMAEIAIKMNFKNEQNARNKHYKCKAELRKIIIENPELGAMLRDLK